MTLDELIEHHAREYGELGAVGELLANDNHAPAPGEVLVSRVLTNGAAIESHVTDGLERMLEVAGVTDSFKGAVREFMRPVVALLADMEKSVIEHVRGKEPEREIDHER
jgi:hypothetical protein